MTSASLVMHGHTVAGKSTDSSNMVLNNICSDNLATHPLGDGGACIMAGYANCSLWVKRYRKFARMKEVQ